MQTLPDKLNESAYSSFYEQLVEHTFASEILQEACFRYNDVVEILHSEVDAYGYDLMLEFRGVIRHVQLKNSREDANTTKQSVSLKLGKKQGGCVIWIVRQAADDHPCRLKLAYRFFGKEPRESLLAELLAKKEDGTDKYQTTIHSRANKDGIKALRKDHRVVKKNDFLGQGKLIEMEELFKLLFA